MMNNPVPKLWKIREEVQAMTDQELQIKVAELDGWTNISRTRSVGNKVFDSGTRSFGSTIPDYTNDLNAMHEAEETLMGNSADEIAWQVNLMDATKDKTEFVRPSARIRAEVFAVTRIFAIAMDAITK